MGQTLPLCPSLSLAKKPFHLKFLCFPYEAPKVPNTFRLLKYGIVNQRPFNNKKIQNKEREEIYAFGHFGPC